MRYLLFNPHYSNDRLFHGSTWRGLLSHLLRQMSNLQQNSAIPVATDLTTQGPITSTGHDLNQLKEVARTSR